METMAYKGFEIQAKPYRLENKQWRINIDIQVPRPAGVKSRNFFADKTFATQEEAVNQYFNFGR
jgi:hypothetical protein